MDSVIAWGVLTFLVLIFSLKILFSLPKKENQFEVYQNDTYSIMEKNRKNRYKNHY